MRLPFWCALAVVGLGAAVGPASAPAAAQTQRIRSSVRDARVQARFEMPVVPYFRDPERQIARPMRSWKAIKEQYVVMQEYDYSCGPASLATVCKYYWGDDVSEGQFLLAVLAKMSREEFEDRVQNGLSLTDLRHAAVLNGYLATMGRRELADLQKLKIPVIVRLKAGEYEHFVVFRGIVDDRVFLADPARGNVRISIHEFAQQWTDGVILVVVKPNTAPPTDSPLRRFPPSPVQHEYQAARSVLFRLPYSVRNPTPRF